MASLVVIEASTGSINRYEVGGVAIRRTHGATLDKPVDFMKDQIESFRVNPPNEFSVDPPPRPTNPPANAGSARIAA